MKKQTNANFLLIAMVIAIIFSAAGVKAQESRLPVPDFSEMEKYYEIVKWTYTDNGIIKMIIKPKTDPPQIHKIFTFRFFDTEGIVMDYKYTICCPGYNQPAGEIERVETPAPEESQLKKIKNIVVYRVLDDGSLVGPKPAEQMKKSSTAVQQTETVDTKTNPAENTGTTGNCSFEKYPQVTPSMKFSEAFIKAELYERYAFEANTGGLTSPLAVGLTFLSIQTGSPYTNTVTVVPGRGAQRRQDGAPPNAKIYPFKAQYIVCNKYSKEVTRTQYESDFVCFIDKGGSWNCPVDSVPKITHLE